MKYGHTDILDWIKLSQANEVAKETATIRQAQANEIWTDGYFRLDQTKLG